MGDLNLDQRSRRRRPIRRLHENFNISFCPDPCILTHVKNSEPALIVDVHQRATLYNEDKSIRQVFLIDDIRKTNFNDANQK